MSNRHPQHRSIARTASIPLRVPAAASALALVLALSGTPAHAQSQPEAQGSAAGASERAHEPDNSAAQRKKTEVLQEVVVTGLRQSLMSAEAIKRLAPQIVDSVSAEDIGALPDRSVAEALQRIPGVMIERTDTPNDPARLTDSGGIVFIRGLSWVKSELDGEEIFSANDGRMISFEDISPDLLAGIDVYKSPTADQIEGGIGGVIDMKTRKPLDSRRNLTAFSADYHYGDMIRKGFPTFNALWSNYWDTGIGRVGVLLSGTYAKDGNRTDSIQLDDYIAQVLPQAEGGLPAGATVYSPNSISWRRLDWEQNRTALDGVFQWQSPSDHWLLTVHAFQTRDNPQNLEFFQSSGNPYLGGADGTAPPPPMAGYSSFNKSGVVTAGVVGIQPSLDTRWGHDHHSTEFFTTSLQWSPNDRFSLSNDVQYTQSHADILSMTAFTQLGDQSGNALGPSAACPSCGTYLAFNVAGNDPSVVLSQNPYEMNNPAAYWWAAAMDHIEDNNAHQWADRLDGTVKFKDSDWLRAFRFGARFQDERAITRQSTWNWSLLSHQYWGGGSPVFLTSTPAWTYQSQPYSDFMRGSVPHPGVGVFPSQALVANTANAYSVLKSTETAGWGWTPLMAPDAYQFANNGTTNDQAQHTYAAYIEADFKHDRTPVGPMDGNIGLRVVRTVDAPGTGALNITPVTGGNIMNPQDCIAQYGQAGCQFLIDAETFTGAGHVVPYHFNANEYTNFLPSLNVRFLLTHDLQWRIAASESITRPSFSQLEPYAAVSYSFASDGRSPSASNPMAGQAGNPQLRPIRSTGVDSSLEWYFAPSGYLAFDVFWKDIHNYITAATEPDTLTNNGLAQTFEITKYENGSHGTLRGVELSYQQFYSFLPWFLEGFGLQGNITLVSDSGGENNVGYVFSSGAISAAQNPALPMEGMSRWAYNAALMYQNHSIEGRLAWNWRQRYLLTTSAANLNRPVWMENYGQLDGEVFYDVTEYLKVGIQGTNLLRNRTYLDVERTSQDTGGGIGLAPRYSWTDTDRTVALAVRLQF